VTWLEERLAPLEPPPPRPGFREELWERVEERERSAARRWRAAAIVSVAVAAAAASAAGVLAFGDGRASTAPIDRTLTCPVDMVGGVHVLRLDAVAAAKPISVNGKLESRPGGFWVEEGLTTNPLQLVFVQGLPESYVLDKVVCTPAPRIPLAASGLPLLTVLHANKGGTLFQECWVAPRVTIRLHLTFGKTGAPVAAQMAIRSGAKQRPVAFFDWTVSRVQASVSRSFCRPGHHP